MSSISKSSVKILPGAVVCNECDLIGNITIGANTIIHPRACIIAEAGPVVIGENNIIEELVRIENRYSELDTGSARNRAMTIGNHNTFEVGCRIKAAKIGDNNVVESKAIIGSYVELSSGCIVGAGCQLSARERLPENSVIYGSRCLRRVQRERPPVQNVQVDFLAKILPNYHYMKAASTGQPVQK